MACIQARISTGLALYILIGAATGFGLSLLPGEFSRKDQVVGALTWPLTWAVFLYGFIRSLTGRED